MIVKRAEILGYCMGVQKAMDAVLKAYSYTKPSDQNNVKSTKFSKRVYTFGPLIHNPATLNYLKKRGIFAIDTENFNCNSDLKDCTIVIRAHGISPQQKAQIQKTGAEVIDATCPRVLHSQKRAKEYSDNRLVILAGDKNHGELIGIAGCVYSEKNSDCVIIQNAEEAKTIPLTGLEAKKGYAVLIAQTTIKKSEYEAIGEVLKQRIPDLIILNTICPATAERQQALKKLADEVDAILVVGGKQSANTKRLLHTALELKKKAWLIEDYSEIPEEIYAYNTVGITAGASTPDFIIEEVERFLYENACNKSLRNC